MDVLLWAFLLFFTSAESAELKKDFVNVAEVYGNTTELILEQNGAMRESVTDEIFETMSKSFDRKLATFGAELNVSLQKLSASLNRNLRRLDSEMGTSHRNLSQVFTRKLLTTQSNVEVSLECLSKALGEELRRSQSKVTLLWNRQELCNSPSDLAASSNSTSVANGPKNQSKVVVRSDVISSQPPVQTEVVEISAEEGTIEFVGGANLELRRKIWVLRSEGGDSVRLVNFVLEQNGLGEDARLSFWGSMNAGQVVWNGTQGDWKKEHTNWGHVILVTLLISPGGAETPSFKLKFRTTRTWGGLPASSEIVSREGRQVVSFPANNTQTYPPGSRFVAVLAPPRGGSFGLALKFLDLPGTPPSCKRAYFHIYFLLETATAEPFKLLPPFAYTRCGNVGAISERLRKATVAIISFNDLSSGHVGMGFRLQVN